MPLAFDVSSGDTVQSHLTLTTAHDGTGTVRIFLTPIRLICSNMLNMAFRSSTTAFSVRHSSSMRKKLSVVGNLLSSAENQFLTFEESAKQLKRKLVNFRVAEEFLSTIFPGKSRVRENQRNKVQELFESGKREQRRIGLGLVQWYGRISR